MRFNWLESKVVSTLFLWSVVVCLSCFAYALFIAVPWGRQFLNSSSANNVLGILFVALVVLTIVCSLIISCGMAIFCVFTDRSTVGAKVLWLLLFLVIWPIGSIAYYFTVYRGVSRGRDPNLTEHLFTGKERDTEYRAMHLITGLTTLILVHRRSGTQLLHKSCKPLFPRSLTSARFSVWMNGTKLNAAVTAMDVLTKGKRSWVHV